MLAESKTFKFGEEVIHADRPEWGRGTITRAQNIIHNGQSAQRLHVRFSNGAGLKVLNTAMAPLRLASDMAAVRATVPGEVTVRTGWIDALEERPIDEIMLELPEPATDPFRTLWQRLEYTLDLYRFKRDPKSITEWAVSQSGLEDPLTRFTRHEIDQYYERWARQRDQHLAKLTAQARREDEARAEQLITRALPEARTALSRVNVRR